jgi:acyl carrier protein
MVAMVTEREAILTRLRTVIEEVAECNTDEIHESHRLEQDLGLDSMDRVELLNTVEDEFSIVFRHPQDRTLTLPDTTVGALVAAVTNLLAMKGEHA